jgi:hypothetical protein
LSAWLQDEAANHWQPPACAWRENNLYGAWRLLTTFETPELCILPLVAEHTRSANPYQMLYDALGID